ncbi:GRB2-related adapter protein-like isoform X2 [Betta splendens]|uniref:GRB2-related adapter protein-like isoform X2 n=1 Tax=Betta splendens TaxID=158456 RepID=A0A9W2Y3Q2_BETSP|nr:GRB2-related adapter protein-like isoform X2 [Betta splendens]
MEALALFSFTASDAAEISFQKGDIIKVTEMEDDSGWVTAEIQGKRGYVPQSYISLLPHPWFAGRVTRLEAEERLRWQDPGVFLLRESESAPGEFSISLSYGDRVEHFRVLEGGGRYCIWEETFPSLNRLVEFYRAHSIAVDKVICLRDPPSSPQLASQSGCNPYPNPYQGSSQESLLSAGLYSPPPHPDRGSSQHLLEPAARGDIIDLLDCSGSMAWRGRCRGRVGIFPPEYVQPLQH